MNPTPGSDIFSAIVPAPFGAMGIRSSGGVLCELFYLPPSYAEKQPQDPVSERAAAQVTRYFEDPDFVFDLPLARLGSEYQRKVWDAICAIPRGEVRTYGQLAKLVGSMPRAIGQACGANFFPIVVPCHRVTAAGGIGGFSNHSEENGFHLNVKRWLLAHEGVAGAGAPWQQQAMAF
ncbi:MAG: methylated-DNA--[protein]-cysteine S-methyltransferase [Telluria sp.]